MILLQWDMLAVTQESEIEAAKRNEEDGESTEENHEDNVSSTNRLLYKY